MESPLKKSSAENLRMLVIVVAAVTVVCAGALLVLGKITAGISVIVLAVPLVVVLLYLSAGMKNGNAAEDQPQRQRQAGAALIVFGVALTLVGGVLAFLNADFLARWLISAGPGFAIGGAIAIWLARSRR